MFERWFETLSAAWHVVCQSFTRSGCLGRKVPVINYGKGGGGGLQNGWGAS